MDRNEVVAATLGEIEAYADYVSEVYEGLRGTNPKMSFKEWQEREEAAEKARKQEAKVAELTKAFDDMLLEADKWGIEFKGCVLNEYGRIAWSEFVIKGA